MQEVSRTAKNVCEMFGAKNWWLIGEPPVTAEELGCTTFLDAADMVYYKKESTGLKGKKEIKRIFSQAL